LSTNPSLHVRQKDDPVIGPVRCLEDRVEVGATLRGLGGNGLGDRESGVTAGDGDVTRLVAENDEISLVGLQKNGCKKRTDPQRLAAHRSRTVEGYQRASIELRNICQSLVHGLIEGFHDFASPRQITRLQRVERRQITEGQYERLADEIFIHEKTQYLIHELR